MPLHAKDSTLPPRPLIPAAVHPANCIGIVDLGTQDGFSKPTHQVLFIWELPEERYQFERDGRQLDYPKIITATYTLSLGDKANLRHILEGWRGRAFTKDEIKAFDLAKVLGAPCQIQVMHKTSAKGVPRAEVRAVLPWPSKTKRLPIERPQCFFSFEDVNPADPRVPEDVPDWVKKKILQAPEWQELTAPAASPGAPEITASNPKDDLPW